MIRCYLTGTQMSMANAYVINRRATRQLIDALTERTRILLRLLEQFSPLDNPPPPATMREARWQPRKHHRLVCKAVAETLAEGYPEILLFLPWTEYRDEIHVVLKYGLHPKPLADGMLPPQDEAALERVQRLARNVLALIDPKGVLAPEVILAISGTVCGKMRDSRPRAVLRAIHSAVKSNDPAVLGIAAASLEALRRHLQPKPPGTEPACGDAS